MPGKVNPVIAESLLMVCAQVIGHDAAIAWCCAAGNFELNVMMPVMAYDLLDPSRCWRRSSRNFLREDAWTGLEADRERVRGVRGAVAGHGDGAGAGDRLRPGGGAGQGGLRDEGARCGKSPGRRAGFRRTKLKELLDPGRQAGG